MRSLPACTARQRLWCTSTPLGPLHPPAYPPAERLTLYSRAIRCKWPRVSSWTCAACAIPGARLQHAWVRGGAAVAGQGCQGALPSGAAACCSGWRWPS